MKNRINSILLQKEPTTGELKVLLFKYGRQKYPELVHEISHELKLAITDMVATIDDLYFGNDLKKDKKHESSF